MVDTAQTESLLVELKKRLGLTKYLGTLGDSDDLTVSTVDEPNRPGYVRVRLYNDDVPYRTVKTGLLGGYSPYPGSPVVVGYDEKGDLAIEKADFDALLEANVNPLVFNSGDSRIAGFGQTDSLLPLWCGAVSEEIGTASTDIVVNSYRYVDTANTAHWFKGVKVDLVGEIPGANLHCYTALFLKDDDTVQIISSTPIATITPLQESDKQECFDARDDFTTPIWLWRLHDSQTSINNEDKVEDLRPWVESSDMIQARKNKFVLYDTTYVPPAEVAGLTYWNPDDKTLNIVTGLGPVLQTNQETVIPFYNDTGFEIANGKALRPVAGFSVGGVLYPTFELAQSDTFENCEGTIVVSTMIVPNATVGIATRFGRVRGINTTGFGAGDDLYVSPTVAGDLTNVKPSFPNYEIKIGGSVDSAADGQIVASLTTDIFDTTRNFWNGTFREAFDFLITSTGGVITGTLTPTNGHDDMTMFFSDVGFQLLDTNPGATIVLTAGANDETPQKNFVYIPVSTKVLTLSTSSFPTDSEHIRVAEILCVTAATTGLEGGARRNQNWNDEIQNTNTDQGHLAHIGEWIRAQPASYVRNTGTVATLTGTTADVYIASDPGDIMQFHRGTMPAQDMTQYTIDAVSVGAKTFTISDDGDLTTTFTDDKIIHVHNSTGNDGHYTIASTNYSAPDFVITVLETPASAVADGTIGDFIIVINDPGTALRKSINLNDITVATDSSTLNNKWFNIVVWGVRNKSGELSYLMCNLPSGNSYLTEANAIADASNETNYTIPDDYNGVGFLIARFTIRKSGASFTYNGGTAFTDLRGQFPSTTPGGSGGGGAGGGTMSSFTIAADAGVPETIVDGDAITLTGGTGISTTVGATDEWTIDVDDDYVKIAGDEMSGTLQITVPTLTDEGLILKSSDDDDTNSIYKIIDSSDVTQLFIAPNGTIARGVGDTIPAVGLISVAGYFKAIGSIDFVLDAGADAAFTFLKSSVIRWRMRNDAAGASEGHALVFSAGIVAPIVMTLLPSGKVEFANGTGVNEFSTDGTLAGDSDDAVPTEKAVKTYVDASGGGGENQRFQARLTLTTATPVMISDTTGTTLYLTPYKGSKIDLYNGSTAWAEFDLTEINITNAGLAVDNNYDVFVYDSTGLTLELVVWTNDTTRATAIVFQDGVYVKSGTTTKRYVGTIRTYDGGGGTVTFAEKSAGGAADGTTAKLFVYNYYNRLPRPFEVHDDTDSWTYSTATFRIARAQSSNKVEMVQGVQEDIVVAKVIGHMSVDSGEAGSAAIGIDSSTAATGIRHDVFISGATMSNASNSNLYDLVGLGYHDLRWIEIASAGTVTFFGDAGGSAVRSGLAGYMWG